MAGKGRRAALSVTLALVGALTAAPAAAHGPSPSPLMPDLFALPVEPGHVEVVSEKSKTLLRLTTEVANRGSGPMEVVPSSGSSDCDGDGDPANDRNASQRIFADTNGSGVFEPESDGVFSERRVGCMRYHPAHQHWHVLDFARYELRREPGGRLVAATRKVGFCLADHRVVYPGPGAPAAAHYPFGAAVETGCDAQAVQGVSVGWADSYPFFVPGQQLDVTGLRRGRYCLSEQIDPLDLLGERDVYDNDRTVRLAMRPRKLMVRRLAGSCRI